MNSMSTNPPLVLPVALHFDPSMSGLEMAHQWIEVGWPGGFVNRLGVRPIEVRAGFMRAECRIDPGHTNFAGVVHGGLTAGLVDVVAGGAALTLLQPNQFLLSIDLSLRFLNAAPANCPSLLAEGKASYHDPRKVIVETRVFTSDSLVIAQGTAAIAIRTRAPKTEPV